MSKFRSRVRRDVGHARREQQGLRRYAVGAGVMLVLAAAISLATGWGTAVAGQIGQVFVTNGPANPVPVQEQRTDANGNIKVHEQGTANVNVTNSSLPVGSPAPITAGSGIQSWPSSGFTQALGTQVASVVQVHMTSDVDSLLLGLGPDFPAAFNGPASGGPADILVPLSRPIKFDSGLCNGDGTGRCTLSWVGASP